MLTSLDASFLELEEGDESAHMHIGWAMVFEPMPDGAAPPIERVRALIDERLSLLPHFHSRLSSPRMGRFSWPSWVPDKRFDIADHVRRATLPEPGGEAELLEWLGDFYSHRLDRAHALWEMTLLDGLADGQWALATKVHHSLVDGISGSWVATAILDAEPSPPRGAPSPLETMLTSTPALRRNEAARNGRANGKDNGGTDDRGRLAAIVGGARAGLRLARHPDKLAATLSRSRAMAEVVVRDEVIAAPRTSLNVRIGATRRFATVEVPLEDLKRIKRQLGGTVNDIVLAATAGGLHKLFEHRGEDPHVESVRAMVPVSVRQDNELLSLGNRVSSLFVELPVGEPNPLLRYRRTMAAAEELKGGGQAAGAEALVELAGAAPPLIHGFVSKRAFTRRLFNLTVTNVPGPQMPFYGCGARLRRVLPLVPIFAGHAVGIAVVSYDGKVTFGLNADRATVPDLEVLRGGIEESLEELRRLMRQPQATNGSRANGAGVASQANGAGQTTRPARTQPAP